MHPGHGLRHYTLLFGVTYKREGLTLAISSSSAASSLIERSVRTSRSNRETLGDRHADTLRSIHDTSGLLRYLGKLQEARPLLEEALQGRRQTLGDRSARTMASISELVMLLEEMGQLYRGGEATVRGEAAGVQGERRRPRPTSSR
jgi:hypothetical protein